MISRSLTVLLCAALGSAAWAQAELTGPRQYPQFRGTSGLPGGGFAIRPDGTVGAGGAMALSSPVAFSLGHWKFWGGLSMLSTDGAIPPFSSRGSDAEFLRGNGTIWQSLGIQAGSVGRLTITNFIASWKLDNTTNYHFQFQLPDERIGVAVGIQDIAGSIGSAGDTFGAADERLSRSAYGVVTVPLGEKTWVSAGIGTERFRRPFGNVSTWVTPRIGLFAEHDGYNWNGGVGWDLGRTAWRFRDREGTAFASFGIVRGKYPIWSLGVAF